MHVPTMNFSKLTNIVLLVVAVCFVGTTLYYRADAAQAHQNAHSAAADAQQYATLAQARLDAHEAARALWRDERDVLTSRADAATKQAQSFKEQRDALNKALNDSREWSDAPVPDSVLNSLKRPSDRL